MMGQVRFRGRVEMATGFLWGNVRAVEHFDVAGVKYYKFFSGSWMGERSRLMWLGRGKCGGSL
jgi:hypothetical protein